MSHKLAQSIGICCLIIGISGITGAMECGTGLIPSAIFFAVGTVIMYLTGRTEKREDGREGELNVR